MNTIQDSRFASTRGAALYSSLVSFAVVSMFSVLMLSAVEQERAGVELDANRTQAARTATGLLELAEQELVARTANFTPFTGDTNGDPFLLETGAWGISNASGTWSLHAGTTDSGGGPTAIATQNSMDPATGLNMILDAYRIESNATFRSSRMRAVRHVIMERIPIFQFMAFYNSDLELHPGPNMLINGRIHANGDLYLGANNSMTIDTQYVRTAGTFHRRKKTGQTQNGWIEILSSVTGNMERLPTQQDLAALGINSAFGLDSDFTGWDLNKDNVFDQAGEMAPFADSVREIFGQNFQTGEHGVTPIAHPELGTIQPYAATPNGTGGDFVQAPGGHYLPVQPGTGTHERGFYHGSAGLRIIDDRIFDGNGNEITNRLPAGFLTQRPLYDAREGQTITVTQLDIGLLGDLDGNPATHDPSPYFPANGLIYAHRTGSVAGSPEGIVLSNGASLAAALTVVSPDPVYVHGNYNTVGKKPASVISDAVNLLSNSWNFSKTPGNLPHASHTTYNLAMITGNHETVGSSYNGGLENLPRFHERWSNRDCIISGSFVNLWESQKATGQWAYGGDRYRAPRRLWSFDTDFDNGDLPPFTPMVINVRSIAFEMAN